MIHNGPYKLINTIQNYEWGERGKNAFIPRLLSIHPQEYIPYAELWIGAHPKSPSKVFIGDDEISLNKLIEKYPLEMLGEKTVTKFGNKLPFLLKVLSAAEPLSIQTHPNKEQAAELHKSDPVNYPDDNHKPEIAIAIDGLTALAGFRSSEEIVEMIHKYKSFQEFVSASKSDVTKSKNFIEVLYKEIVNKFHNKSEAEKFVLSLKNEIGLKSEISRSEAESLFLKMYSVYGVDIGLVSIMLLNHIKLESGDALFTSAGIPHAYIKGNIVECMANSDNVIRAGLTPKKKDIKNLTKILKYEGGKPGLVKTRAREFLTEYLVDAAEFKPVCIDLKENDSLELAGNNKPYILLNLEGISYIYAGEMERMSLERGESIFIPAVVNNIKMICGKSSKIISVTVNL